MLCISLSWAITQLIIGGSFSNGALNTVPPNHVYRITVLGTGPNQTSYVHMQDGPWQRHAVSENSIFEVPDRIENCSGFEQLEIRKCAEVLYSMGALRETDDINDFQLSWQCLFGQTRDFLESVCENFLIFDNCIGPYKDSCFMQEPTRTRYQAAIAVLEFLCGNGYDELHESFECFSQTLSRAEMLQCQADAAIDTKKLPPMITNKSRPYEVALCGVVRNYVDCVKYPVRHECGYRGWYTLREMLVRPMTSLIPDCNIAGMRETRSAWDSFYDIVAGLFTAVSERYKVMAS